MTTNKWDRESEAHWSVYCPPRPTLKFAYQKREGWDRHSFQSITGFTESGQRERLRAPPSFPLATLRWRHKLAFLKMGVCGGGGEPFADRAAEETGGAYGRREEARAALPHPGPAPLSPRGSPRRGRQPDGSSGRRPAPHAAPYARPRRPAGACPAPPPPAKPRTGPPPAPPRRP